MLVKGYDEAGQNLDDLSERTITFRDGSFELCILNMYSALVVYTAYCALQIVRLTLRHTFPDRADLCHKTRFYAIAISNNTLSEIL